MDDRLKARADRPQVRRIEFRFPDVADVGGQRIDVASMSGRTPSPVRPDSKMTDVMKAAVIAHLTDPSAIMGSPSTDSECTESITGDASALEVEEYAHKEDAAGILLNMIEADGSKHLSLRKRSLGYRHEGGVGESPETETSQGHPNAKIEIETGSSVLFADSGADIDAASTLLELSQGGHVFTEGNTRLKKGVDKYWAQGDAMAANIRNSVLSEQKSQSLSARSTAPVTKRALSPRKQCLMDMCADKPGDRSSGDEDRRGLRQHRTPSMRQQKIMEGQQESAYGSNGRCV
ncbi:hypothetical protein LTR95_007929 [Oleoguttula sp. CCFEE 5521]